MGAFAGKSIQVYRQGSDQRLAFASAHFGDLALMEHHPTHQLHVEMSLPQCALGSLAYGGKGFG